MKITIESTTKIVDLNGIPARIWEGETDTGIKVHCYITRIAHHENYGPAVQDQFKRELQEHTPPTAEIEAIPGRLIL